MDFYYKVFDTLDNNSSDWHEASLDDDSGLDIAPPPDSSPLSPRVSLIAGPSNLEGLVELTPQVDPPAKKKKYYTVGARLIALSMFDDVDL